MDGFVRVGSVDDFVEGRGRAVRVDGKKVAVFKVAGVIRAIQDDCPHMGASLADGKLDGERVICHWHHWRFDLKTGQGDQRSRAWLCARVYEVRIENGEVLVRSPAPPEPDPVEEDEPWVEWDDRFLKPKTPPGED